MLTFKQFIAEERGATLVVFDIDETLFHTKAKVKVVKDKKVIRELDNQEFNSYKLRDGEQYDFGQFKSSEIFKQTSTPIGRMIGRLKTVLRNMTSKNSQVILSTARQNFDNKEVFLDTFRSYGIDIDRVYVERTGNLGLGSSAKNKRFTFHKYLRKGIFNKVRFFDDSKDNINSFKSLRKHYPNIEFEAWLVGDNGIAKRG